MAISVFPAPAASGGGGVSAFAAAIPALSTTYEHIQNFEAGVYSVAVAPTSTNAALSFVNATGLLNNITTTSGIVSFTMASPATRVFITLGAGGTPGAIVTINKTANPLSPDDVGNGTVDTINATGTYNQTGLLGVLLIGGGAAGERGSQGGALNEYASKPGGRAGFINAGFVVANAPTTVTVGAKGVAANTNNESTVAPTNSSFGNLLTANAASNIFTNGNGGNSPDSGGASSNAGSASGAFLSWNGNSTTGGGGAGGPRTGNNPGVGGGSGIGTGGTGARGTGNYTNFRANVAATDATGKGAGGGGGCYVTNSGTNDVGRFGSDGSDGVVYIVRGF